MVSHRPVPVQSCWNGMGKSCHPSGTQNSVVLNPLSTLRRHSPETYFLVIFDSSPFYQTPPLRFRGISDSLAAHHLEGSECCLIHADNLYSARDGVWLNPNVRVGYDPSAYAAVHSVQPWPAAYDRFIGLWGNRIRRWVTTVRFKEWVVRRRLQKWAKEDRHRREPGPHCLINEMQVLIYNGWAHV